jgi:phosphatidylglycerol:prolipoprotein diacylglycerol transferase
MITITLDPIIAHLGPFVLRWYSLILMVAIGVGVWLTAREAERRGMKKDDVYEVSIYIILGGILGARFFHVLDQWSNEFAANPIRALYVWEGGLAIWGAVAGGLVVAALICWKRGWRFPILLDAAALGLVLAQAIGRIACVITGDAMGKPTDGPFGFAYTSSRALVPQLGVYYTPMPVYEIIANLLIFTVLWQLRSRKWADGSLFILYLILYSLERFFLAFTSSYRVLALGMTQSQIIALIGLISATAILVLRSRVLSKQTV